MGKNHGNGKAKLAYAPKAKISPPPKKEHPTKDVTCHHCNEVGHRRRRNCPAYLVELKKKKKKTSHASTSDYGISVSKDNVIYFNTIPRDGIYEIDMHNFISNDSSMYSVKGPSIT
ncbi:reverse transcriptase domain-containing protein [Tanacetum coccineum]